MAMIEVRNLSKRYKKLDALSGVNFDIEQGDIFGYIGPNGAGGGKINGSGRDVRGTAGGTHALRVSRQDVITAYVEACMHWRTGGHIYSSVPQTSVRGLPTFRECR